MTGMLEIIVIYFKPENLTNGIRDCGNYFQDIHLLMKS